MLLDPTLIQMNLLNDVVKQGSDEWVAMPQIDAMFWFNFLGPLLILLFVAFFLKSRYQYKQERIRRETKILAQAIE